MSGIRISPAPFKLTNKSYDMKVTGAAGSGSNPKNPYLLGSNFITYYFKVNILSAGTFTISKAPEDIDTGILSYSMFAEDESATEMVLIDLGTTYRVSITTFVSTTKLNIILTTKR